jgi:hypothetical protein
LRGPTDDQEPLDLIEIAAELVKNFPGMTQEAIRELDRWWIAFVYFARRDKYGSLKVRSKPREGSRKLDAREAWIESAERNWGYPEWYAEREYDARMAEQAKQRQAMMKSPRPILVHQ